MTRKIEVTIGQNGEVVVEFSGFPGEECFTEAERLQALLASLGLEVDVKDVVRKSAAEIERELGITAEQEKQLKIRRSP